METRTRTIKPKNPDFQIDYTDFKNSDNIQGFILKQLWLAGGTLQTSVGAPITNTIKWGGQSRYLVGFNFFAPTITAHSITVTLNNEKIIDNVPAIFLCPNGGGGNVKQLQYFEFIRPLSGSDVLEFSTTSTVAESFNYGIYMTRAYNEHYVRK